ncbi:MAG: OmpA family protein, partial [bacterium]
MGRMMGFIPLLACVLLGGCFLVPESTYKSVLREREDCQREVKLLKEASLSSASRVKELEGKVDSLEARLADIKVEKSAEIERVSTSYENLVKELKDEIERGEVKVKEMEGKLTLNMMAKILFDLGKAEIKPSGKDILNRIGPVLRRAENREIRVEGHTDSLTIHGELSKKYPTNWELSTARATNVVRHLEEKVGIDPERLVAMG